jgi:FixJ family two-component response regulator
MRAGAADYLQKPPEFEALVRSPSEKSCAVIEPEPTSSES